MILQMLGTLDILAAMAIVFREGVGGVAVLLGLAVLLKGIISIIGSFSEGYYADIMGAVDILSGISLASGFSIPFVWILLLLKGIFSVSSA